MTDFLIGITVGATCSLGLSIAFILFAMRFARKQRSRDRQDCLASEDYPQ